MDVTNSTFDRERDYVLRTMNRNFAGAFLAGGALTSTFTNKPIADYDLYFKSRKAFEDAVHEAYDSGLWCVNVSSRAITFADGPDVFQFMHFAFFETAEQIFDSFDFTCCMAAINLDEKTVQFHPNFLSDTSKRELVFNHRTAYPLASGLRVLKYQERGFTIRKSEMLKIVTACAFRELNTWDDLKDQIGGAYGETVMLDTSKDFTLDEAVGSFALIEKKNKTVESPGSPEEALERIFGSPMAQSA